MLVVWLFRRSVGYGWLVAGIFSLLPASVLAQQDNRPAQSDLVKQAYQISRTARTEKQYTQDHRALPQGAGRQSGEKQTAYARKLAAWSYNRRGEAAGRRRRRRRRPEGFRPGGHDSIRTHWRALHNRGVGYAARDEIRPSASRL